MSEAVGIESFIPFGIFIDGFAAFFFMLAIYGVLYYLIIKRDPEFSKFLITLGFISYLGFLFFSWSFCAPVFQIFSDADIFIVEPLSFVLWATLILILLPIVGVILAIFQSLG